MAGCMPKGRMEATVNLNPAKEIVYRVKNGQDKIITDPEKIKRIIHILHRARKTIVKFMPKEEIVIKKEDGSVFTILKSEEYMKMEGGMFKLTRKQKRRLNEVFNNVGRKI